MTNPVSSSSSVSIVVYCILDFWMDSKSTFNIQWGLNDGQQFSCKAAGMMFISSLASINLTFKYAHPATFSMTLESGGQIENYFTACLHWRVWVMIWYFPVSGLSIIKIRVSKADLADLA